MSGQTPAALPVPLVAALVALSAFLLFQVEPILGRALLPWFGGAPAVWNTCLVFFQVALVASYAYAHALQRLPHARQARVHTALLVGSVAWLAALAVLWGAPLLPGAGWRPPDARFPALRVLGLLGAAVGLPFFTLGTTAPLVQAWVSTRAGEGTYRLYAASNAGALLALLTYPAAFERLFPLSAQAWIWAAAYLVFAAGAVLLAWRAPGEASLVSAPALGRGRLSWLLLPAIGSVLLLSTTTQVTQNVAPLPLLWVATLALYLLSLILCFERAAWYRREVWVPVWTLALLLVALAVHRVGPFESAALQLATFGVALFAGCMVVHGETVRRRPPAAQLTAFYLWTAVGSALGGGFVALAAPWLFHDYLEFPVALGGVSAVALMAVFGDARRYLALGRWRLALLGWAAGLAALLEAATSAGASAPGLSRVRATRDFFGVLQVLESGRAPARDHVFSLLCGRVVHGAELAAPDLLHTPTTYHTQASGVGLALAELHRRGAGLRIGVLGLGVGGLAALTAPGDAVRFYEIDPEVDRLARGEGGYFHFLDGLAPPAEVVLGDARLSLEREPPASPGAGFDLLVVDAFSGDAVPVHLLTAEAMAVYLRVLRPGGVVAFNVTNRHLELARVVAGLAARFQLGVALVASPGSGPDALPSRWMLLSSDRSILEAPSIAAASEPAPAADAVLWTDQRIDLLSVLRWRW